MLQFVGPFPATYATFAVPADPGGSELSRAVAALLESRVFAALAHVTDGEARTRARAHARTRAREPAHFLPHPRYLTAFARPCAPARPRPPALAQEPIVPDTPGAAVIAAQALRAPRGTPDRVSTAIHNGSPVVTELDAAVVRAHAREADVLRLPPGDAAYTVIVTFNVLP